MFRSPQPHLLPHATLHVKMEAHALEFGGDRGSFMCVAVHLVTLGEGVKMFVVKVVTDLVALIVSVIIHSIKIANSSA